MFIFVLQVASTVDAMKYSLESSADKYRPPYLPQTSFSLSMYSAADQKYFESASKPYSYLDQAFTKYFESSKMYADPNKSYISENNAKFPYSPLDLGKMYSDTGPKQSMHTSTRVSADVERNQTEPKPSPSSSLSSSGLSPGAWHSPTSSVPSLLPLSQYVNHNSHYHQGSPATSNAEFRRPLTVIF